MPQGPRYLERYAAHDDSLSFDFPLYEYEWQVQQPFRTSMVPVVGADYRYDVLGFSPAPVDNARHTVRGVFLPSSWTEYNTVKADAFSKFRRIGQGKLYTIDESSVRRFAWARAKAMPDVTLSAGTGRILPLIFDFETLTDFQATASVQGTITLNSATQTFQITNPGDILTESIVFRIRSSSTTGFSNPLLRNNSANTLYEFQSTRDATSASDELRIDTEQWRVQYSTNDGASYTDDYALMAHLPTQGALFGLKPGVNDIEYRNTGIPNALLEYYFFPKYAA